MFVFVMLIIILIKPNKFSGLIATVGKCCQVVRRTYHDESLCNENKHLIANHRIRSPDLKNRGAMYKLIEFEYVVLRS